MIRAPELTKTEERAIQDETDRCDHGLLACRKCYTLPPGVNRFYGPRRGVRAQLREEGRWLLVVPNRADRRRARGELQRVPDPTGVEPGTS